MQTVFDSDLNKDAAYMILEMFCFGIGVQVNQKHHYFHEMIKINKFHKLRSVYTQSDCFYSDVNEIDEFGATPLMIAL